MPGVRTILLWVGRIAVSLASLGIVAAMTYLTLVQRWHLAWGATAAEQRSVLPGDEIVPDPAYWCTRAITIHTRAEEIWQWLVQIGQDRAGFYSYDWLERLMDLEIHNTERVVAEWQSLETGDTVNLGPGVTMEVAAIRHGHWLVFDMAQWQPASWAFVLEPIDRQTTRLIIRMRCHGAFLHYSPFDPGHFVMERKMMLRIKELAEGTAGSGWAWPGNEAIWFAAVIAAAPGLLILVLARRWPWSLVLATAAAAGWVLVVFRGHPSPLYGGLLVGALAGAHIWAWRSPRKPPP